MELGVDIVEVARFDEELCAKTSFLRKVFTPEEIKYCRNKSNPAPCYAARFAAKEAVIKALSPFSVTPALHEIEVKKAPSGAPFIVLHLPSASRFTIKISISYERFAAVAVALVEENVCEPNGSGTV